MRDTSFPISGLRGTFVVLEVRAFLRAIGGVVVHYIDDDADLFGDMLVWEMGECSAVLWRVEFVESSVAVEM